MTSLADVAAIVAGNLNLDAADAAVLAATSAAWRFAAISEGLEQHSDPAADTGTDLDPLADPMTQQGLIGFSRAVYLDAIASRGAQVALGDSVADTVFTPEDPYRHWRHYFAPLADGWGIA